MKKKLLQINVSANWGSTGRIAEQINEKARDKGWDCYIAYGREMSPCNSKLIKVGNTFCVYEHYAEHRLFDNEGMASRLATKQLIQKIEELSPDIIHLHNIHDHWLNYKILFKYLNSTNIPIVWTQHDCWAYTGGCAYYSVLGCDKWQTECKECLRKGIVYDRSNKQFLRRKKLFASNNNLILVPVSNWLEKEIKKSFMKGCEIRTISNGVNIDVFHKIDINEIRSIYGIGNKFLMVAAATSWTERKGLNDYINLSKMLPDDYVILLVGLTAKQIANLPKSMVGIRRSSNVHELAAIYSAADVVMNLSREETFGLTTVEGYACGTPAIVYNATASPELVTSKTGYVVEQGDMKGIISALFEIKSRGKDSYSYACRKLAEELYDKDKCFEKYLELYQELVR